jgi:hypothetical protein
MVFGITGSWSCVEVDVILAMALEMAAGSWTVFDDKAGNTEAEGAVKLAGFISVCASSRDRASRSDTTATAAVHLRQRH